MFKQADKLIVGNLVAINAAITSAGMEGQEIHAIDRLRNIKGIKTAVASAILTVCYPQKFSIIDVRVLRELNLTPTAAGLWSAKMYWEEFIPKVQSFASEHKLSLRDADKVLWGQSVYKDIMARLQ